jgi:hypothetical protein
MELTFELPTLPLSNLLMSLLMLNFPIWLNFKLDLYRIPFLLCLEISYTVFIPSLKLAMDVAVPSDNAVDALFDFAIMHF